MNILQGNNARHSIKKQWYVFYLLVLIIPILVMLSAYRLSYGQLSEAVYDRQMAYLTQIRDLMDSQARNVSDTMLSFAVNEQVREAVAVKDPAGEMKMPLFRSILSQISNASVSNDLVDHYALYFEESDYLIDGNYLIPRRVISWKDYEGSIREQECAAIVDSAKSSNLSMMAGRSGNLILYTKSAVYRTHQPLYAAAVLSGNELRKRLGSGADHEEAAVAIASPDGMILVTNSPERFDAYQNDSRKWFFAEVESDAVPLRFLYISPKRIVEARLISYRYMLYAFLAAALILGLIAIRFAVQRQYAPVARLMERFSSDQETLSNEYRNISRYLLEAEERNDRHFLTDLLLGNVQEEGVFPYQALLLLSPADGGRLTPPDSDRVQDLLPGARVIPIYESLVLIFQHQLPEEEALSAALRSLFADAAVYQVYALQNGQPLHDTYVRAADFLVSLRFFQADPAPLRRLPAPGQESPLQIMTGSFEEAVRAAILNRNEEKAWHLMQSALDNMREKCRSGSLLRGSLYAVSILFLHLEAAVRAQNAAIPDGVSGNAVRGYQYQDIQALTEGTRQAIHDLIASLGLQRSRKAVTLAGQIDDYIREHFSSPDLTMDQIADHFNFSAVYLRRVYKQDFGISITDALLKKRIDTARQMLQNPASRVSDVAQAVGFLDTGTFIRGFKKLEGITPGAYRDRILGGGSGSAETGTPSDEEAE